MHACPSEACIPRDVGHGGHNVCMISGIVLEQQLSMVGRKISAFSFSSLDGEDVVVYDDKPVIPRAPKRRRVNNASVVEVFMNTVFNTAFRERVAAAMQMSEATRASTVRVTEKNGGFQRFFVDMESTADEREDYLQVVLRCIPSGASAAMVRNILRPLQCRPEVDAPWRRAWMYRDLLPVNMSHLLP